MAITGRKVARASFVYPNTNAAAATHSRDYLSQRYATLGVTSQDSLQSRLPLNPGLGREPGRSTRGIVAPTPARPRRHSHRGVRAPASGWPTMAARARRTAPRLPPPGELDDGLPLLVWPEWKEKSGRRLGRPSGCRTFVNGEVSASLSRAPIARPAFGDEQVRGVDRRRTCFAAGAMLGGVAGRSPS